MVRPLGKGADSVLGKPIELSIVIPVLNSHEIVRRQFLHWSRLDLTGVEIILMDDGSDPPIEGKLQNVSIYRTGDTRPWTWALARNAGARRALGEYLFMTDIDYIISQEALDDAWFFTGDRLGFKREFGVLDPYGNFTQNIDVLKAYGLDPQRIAVRGVKMPPHPNNFVMKTELFWKLGGYREDLIGKPYPQGEDRHFKKALLNAVAAGEATMTDTNRPTLYMFPNGQFCGDVDHNPFGLFHNLSRKAANA